MAMCLPVPVRLRSTDRHRAWLMLGDCIRCGTSVELTEEQEREARDGCSTSTRCGRANRFRERLLSNHRSNPSRRRPGRNPARIVQQPVLTIPVPPPSPRRPLPNYVKPARSYDWLHDLPAWLVSLIFHLVMMMLLGLWTLKAEEDRQIVLSAVYGTDRQEGEPGIFDPKVDEVVFEDPGKPPENETPRSRRAQGGRRVAITQRQAGATRPKLSAVVAALSKPTDQRMFEGRDPRIRTTVLNREGGTSLTEAAVHGLRWLSKHQEKNGSWSSGRILSCRRLQWPMSRWRKL